MRNVNRIVLQYILAQMYLSQALTATVQPLDVVISEMHKKTLQVQYYEQWLQPACQQQLNSTLNMSDIWLNEISDKLGQSAFKKALDVCNA